MYPSNSSRRIGRASPAAAMPSTSFDRFPAEADVTRAPASSRRIDAPLVPPSPPTKKTLPSSAATWDNRRASTIVSPESTSQLDVGGCGHRGGNALVERSRSSPPTSGADRRGRGGRRAAARDDPARPHPARPVRRPCTSSRTSGLRRRLCSRRSTRLIPNTRVPGSAVVASIKILKEKASSGMGPRWTERPEAVPSFAILADRRCTSRSLAGLLSGRPCGRVFSRRPNPAPAPSGLKLRRLETLRTR